ncbi:Alpha beta hydrolase fold-3 protein [Rutstroemia sp. NJR-2017a BVV2]|nr:Alpha beta hydrolase fold-3 protein [Rutstroemia sp. NJR-2017a BVV2]
MPLVHDTLQAYTWLLNTYLPSLFPDPPPPPSGFYPIKPIQRPLLIYGSYLGGTLATSLALTESYTSTNQKTKIHSLVVHNGIFDWTPFSTTPDPVLLDKSSIPPYISTPDLYSQKPWTTDILHTLKTRLFPSPSQTFDAFASPILFFRRPGIEVPQRWPIPPPPKSESSSSPDSPTEELPVPPSLEDFPSPPDDPDDSDIGSPPSNLWDDELEDHPHEPLETSRKSHLIFPPPKSLLKLPRSLFLYSKFSLPDSMGSDGKVQKGRGKDNENEITSDEADEKFEVFREQAEEMQRVMQRSIKLHELRDRIRWDDECDPEAIAGERVSVKGVGWGAVKGGGGIAEAEEAELESVVKGWFEEGGL